MDNQCKYAFFKGKIVPMAEAKVSIMNHAFMYGTAVFEGIRGYWNEEQKQMFLLCLPEHLYRMFDSMKIMRLESSYSIDDLIKHTIEVVKRNDFHSDVYIRPSAYKAAERVGPGLYNNPTEISIFAVPFGDYFKDQNGLNVCISNWRRVEDNAIPARAKIVGAYANTALAKTDAVLSGFDECIVLSENGSVSEGSAMNIFVIKNGQLITPAGTENILEGITRKIIMTIAENDLNLKTSVRAVDRSELYIADELFFCGTGAQVTPIISVDKRTIGNGKAGPITTKLMEQYYAMSQGKIDKYKNWLTPVY